MTPKLFIPLCRRCKKYKNGCTILKLPGITEKHMERSCPDWVKK